MKHSPRRFTLLFTFLLTLPLSIFAAPGEPPWLQGSIGQFLKYVFGNEQYWFDQGVFMLKFLLFLLVAVILSIFLRLMRLGKAQQPLEEKHVTSLSIIISLIFTAAIPSDVILVIYKEYTTIISAFFVLLPLLLVILLLYLEHQLRTKSEWGENRVVLATLYLFATGIIYTVKTAWDSFFQRVVINQTSYSFTAQTASGSVAYQYVHTITTPSVYQGLGVFIAIIFYYFLIRTILEVWHLFSHPAREGVSTANAMLAKRRERIEQHELSEANRLLSELRSIEQGMEKVKQDDAFIAAFFREATRFYQALRQLERYGKRLPPEKKSEILELTERLERHALEIAHKIKEDEKILEERENKVEWLFQETKKLLSAEVKRLHNLKQEEAMAERLQQYEQIFKKLHEYIQREGLLEHKLEAEERRLLNNLRKQYEIRRELLLLIEDFYNTLRQYAQSLSGHIPAGEIGMGQPPTTAEIRTKLQRSILPQLREKLSHLEDLEKRIAKELGVLIRDFRVLEKELGIEGKYEHQLQALARHFRL